MTESDKPSLNRSIDAHTYCQSYGVDLIGIQRISKSVNSELWENISDGISRRSRRTRRLGHAQLHRSSQIECISDVNMALFSSQVLVIGLTYQAVIGPQLIRLIDA